MQGKVYTSERLAIFAVLAAFAVSFAIDFLFNRFVIKKWHNAQCYNPIEMESHKCTTHEYERFTLSWEFYFILDVVPIAVLLFFHRRNFALKSDESSLNGQNAAAGQHLSEGATSVFSGSVAQSATVSGVFKMKTQEDVILMQLLPKFWIGNEGSRDSGEVQDSMCFSENNYSLPD